MKIQRDYGGAYDIDPYSYFTRDDLLELSDAVLEILNRGSTDDSYFDFEDIWIDDDDTIVMTVLAPDDESVEGSVTIDMRRIRKPSDILKYADLLATELNLNSKLYREDPNDLLYSEIEDEE